MKRCSRCGETKPLEAFVKAKQSPSGRGSHCKACKNAHQRERAAQLSANYVPAPIEGERTCSTCGATKPLTEFGRRKDSPTGFRSACNPCKRTSDTAAMQRWRERNPELDRQRAREWVETHREQERKRSNRYDAANRKKRRDSRNRRRKENPQYERDLQRRWRQAHPERARDAYYRWRETTREPSEDTISYIAVLLKDPCAYCGEPMWCIDHIEPRSQGGAHDWTNLTACCRSCNPAKRDKPLLVWLVDRFL